MDKKSQTNQQEILRQAVEQHEGPLIRYARRFTGETWNALATWPRIHF